jgi:hypothetical protein
MTLLLQLSLVHILSRKVIATLLASKVKLICVVMDS